MNDPCESPNILYEYPCTQSVTVAFKIVLFQIGHQVYFYIILFSFSKPVFSNEKKLKKSLYLKIIRQHNENV